MVSKEKVETRETKKERDEWLEAIARDDLREERVTNRTSVIDEIVTKV